MKKFIRLITAAVSCMIIASCSMMCAFAASGNSAEGFDGDTSACGVYDDKGLFSDTKLEELNELVRETADELDIYIAIYLSDTARSESATTIFSDEAYEELFGADSDGVFYYMDLSEQYSAYDYISTSGKGMLLYDNHIDAMLESIFRYLPASGEPIESYQIESGIKQICSIFREYGKDDPGFFDYEYDSYTQKYIYFRDGETVITSSKPAAAWLRGLIFGVPVGLIVGLMVYFITKSRYKFKESCNPHVYVAHDETKFTQREDRFIRTYTTKTKIESSSSSSHGGGGRSHGGSGSHGGGGRHR